MSAWALFSWLVACTTLARVSKALGKEAQQWHAACRTSVADFGGAGAEVGRLLAPRDEGGLLVDNHTGGEQEHATTNHQCEAHQHARTCSCSGL